MANRHRGEIEAELGGQTLTLCLTLGALAELEGTFGEEDMLALAERFSTGRLRARDAIRILGAGLRGAGHEVSDEQVARMRVENGAAGFVAIVAELLAVTFTAADPASTSSPVAGTASAKAHGMEGIGDGVGPMSDEAAATGPFPGRT